MKNNKVNYHIIYLGVAIIVIAGIALYSSFASFNRSLVNSQQQQLLNIVRSVSNSINIYIDEQKSALYGLTISTDFRKTIEDYENTQNITTLVEEYLSANPKGRVGFLITNKSGKILANISSSPDALKYNEDVLNYDLTDVIYPQVLGSYLSKEHAFLLPIAAKVSDDIYVVSLIDFADINAKITSVSIKADEKSYIIVKEYTGIILLHESVEQIGLHATNGREERYPDVDFSKMNMLIEKELEGQEDVYIFDSYWFSDNQEPIPAKKFSAFTPLNVDYGFWVISINMDYNNFIAPLNRHFYAMGTLFFAIIAVLVAMVVSIWRYKLKQISWQKQNEYLRELNTTLDELNKEKAHSHHTEKLRMVGIMTSGIAHEFNNILSPVMGYSELLIEELPEDTISYNDAKEIYDASCRAKELVKQISYLSRKNIGKIVFQNFDLKDKLPTWLKSVSMMKPENVDFEYNICHQELPVFASETQLYEMILNLCTNAFQAMGKVGDKLVFTVQKLPKSEISKTLELNYHSDEYICISIKDTGYGMSVETMQNIFTPFFTTKKYGEGTGLGLSIVQNIILQHQGDITCQSEIGNGSEFCVYLPVSNAESPENAQLQSNQDTQQSLTKILIIDDNAKVAHMISRLLKRKGFVVDVATTPKNAINLFTTQKIGYQLVISDYSMAQMNGVELALQLKRINSRVKIIIVSGVVKKSVLAAHQQGTVDAYLMKPVNTEELLEKIKDCFHKSN